MTTPDDELRKPLLERLGVLKSHRLEFLQPSPIYVPVLCSVSQLPYAKSHPLEEHVQKLFSEIQDGSRVTSVVVLGPSGSGKTITMRSLERNYWHVLDLKDVGRRPQIVPILLELREIALAKRYGFEGQRQGESTPLNLRQFALDRLNGLLTGSDLSQLENLNIHVLWMFDGYDEMGTVQILGKTLEECRLSIVSCRDSFAYDVLGEKVSRYLRPLCHPSVLKYNVLYVRGFDRERVQEYLTQALSLNAKLRNQWTVAGFTKVIQAVPGLSDQSQNPLMLSLIVNQAAFWTAETSLGPQVSSEEKGDLPYENRVHSTDVLRKFLAVHYHTALRKCRAEPDWQVSFEANFVDSCERFCSEVALYMYEKDTFAVDVSHEPLHARLSTTIPSYDSGLKTFILRSVPLEVR